MKHLLAAVLLCVAFASVAEAGPNAWGARQLHHWCLVDTSKKDRCDGYIAGVVDMHTMLALGGSAMFCLPTPDKLSWGSMYGLVIRELQRQADEGFPELYAVLVVRNALAPTYPPNADGTCNTLF